MLPLITAALGVLQQNQQKQEDRKKQMEQAAMGQFANAGPPAQSAGGGLGSVVGALGGLAGGGKEATPAPMANRIGQNGGQPLTAGTDAALDSALGDGDEDDNPLPMRGNRY